MTSYTRPLLDLSGDVNADDASAPKIRSGVILMEIDTGTTGRPGHTAIVVPSTVTSSATIDVILYFHGTHAPRIGEYVRRRKFKSILEQNGKRVVLVAPALGWESEYGKLGDATPLRDYLAKVMQALADYGPFGAAPKIGTLILAAHSGGGRALIVAAEALGDSPDLKTREAWGFDCMYGLDTPLAAPEPYKVALAKHPTAKDLADWKARNAKSLEARWKAWANGNHVFRVFYGAGDTKTRTANLDLMDQLDSGSVGIIMHPRFYRMGNDGVVARVKPEPGPVVEHDLVPQTVLGDCITSCPWLK